MDPSWGGVCVRSLRVSGSLRLFHKPWYDRAREKGPSQKSLGPESEPTGQPKSVKTSGP